MPLPTGNPDWPPPHLGKATALYREWGAWYSGDPAALAEVYAASLGTEGDLGAERGSALLGARTRRFWGMTQPGNQLRPARLHIPLAADIAGTSSDLLFGETPELTVDEEAGDAAQDRLEEYLDDGGLAAVLLEAGELCAAYGGVYVRTGWDKEVADYPLFDAIPPDVAVPEFRSGRLVAVTFWREVGREAGKTLRHLERHEAGRIFHGLYAGTDTKLGDKVDLRAHQETEPFATLVGAQGFAETGATRLAVEYIPNMRPHRKLRGSQLGRSDFDGSEGLMDALDEAWSSWMRDLRIGKGRLVVPSVYLQSRGRGNGAKFDPEQEVFEQVDALPGKGEGLAMSIVQFNIRVAEHRDTVAELTTTALRNAGYSAQTFGETGEVASTATEVNARERRSMATRKRKIGYWRPAMRRLLTAALEIDAKQFGPDKVRVAPVMVEFAPAVVPDQEANARVWQMLRAADLMSIEIGVRAQHPEWGDTEVAAEVKKIREDRGDTAAAGPPGAGTDDAAADADPEAQQQPAGPNPTRPGQPDDGRPPTAGDGPPRQQRKRRPLVPAGASRRR